MQNTWDQRQPFNSLSSPDRQTKRVNQVLKQYLHIFINYQQDDWANLLPLAEFMYNNTVHLATQVTPFFENKGIHSKLEVSLTSVALNNAYSQCADLQMLHQYLCNQIKYTIHSCNENMKSNNPLIFSLETRSSLIHVTFEQNAKKLDYQCLGPYSIIAKISSHTFQLGLPLYLL